MHEGRLSADAITRERASSQRRTGVERERRFLSSRRIGIRRASFSLHLRAAAAAALPLAPIYTPRRAQSSAGGRIPSPPRQNSLSLFLLRSRSLSLPSCCVRARRRLSRLLLFRSFPPSRPRIIVREVGMHYATAAAAAFSKMYFAPGNDSLLRQSADVQDKMYICKFLFRN